MARPQGAGNDDHRRRQCSQTPRTRNPLDQRTHAQTKGPGQEIDRSRQHLNDKQQHRQYCPSKNSIPIHVAPPPAVASAECIMARQQPCNKHGYIWAQETPPPAVIAHRFVFCVLEAGMSEKIKKISTGQLRVGMFLHDLDCGWMDHPFVRSRFQVTDEAQIQKIIDAGIHDVYIDTARGLDVTDAPTAAEVRANIEQKMIEIATQPTAPIKVDVASEIGRAKQIKDQASRLVRDVMHDVRLGKAVELEQVEPMVQTITESVLRNGGALLTLLRIKNKDDYTFLHSVSVGTLLIAFCRSVDIDTEVTHQAGLGGLLHDTGKAFVPDEVLNKPGRLTEEEFEIIKRHPKDGWDVLIKTPEIGEIPRDITLHHHERIDGSGYPDKLPGDKIATLAKMAAIVDVYDAITADRCYHKGMSATDALRKLYEWSTFHFEPTLVQAFMRCVGIYPVGTLVKLESGKLGVVVEQNGNSLLTPVVKVIFSTKSNGYVEPYLIDLARPLGSGGGDRIVGHEDPVKWKIDAMRFLST